MTGLLFLTACKFTIYAEAIDIEDGCWYSVSREISTSTRLKCNDATQVVGTDEQGRCLRFNPVCFQESRQDWLAGCDAVPGCCDAMMETLPACWDIGVTPE
jgi:hypothetical protein